MLYTTTIYIIYNAHNVQENILFRFMQRNLLSKKLILKKTINMKQ